MGIFKKSIKYSKPLTDLDNKIKKLDEELEQTGIIIGEEYQDSVYDEKLNEDNTPKIYEEYVEVSSDKEPELYDWRKSFISEEFEEEDNYEENDEYKSLVRVENYISESNKELIQIRDQVFQEISESTLLNLPDIKNKISRVLEIYDKIEEGLLNEPPETENEDPLTPLNQDFVTVDELNKHYTLFINRIQEQIATIGGGGETQLKYLDDIVGISTNASEYDGKYLKYDHSIEKFVFDTVSGGGGGGTQGTQGLQGSSGYVGADGPQGTQGLQGSSGYVGADGPQGTQGLQGDQGVQGTQGLQGDQGVQGTQGIQGTQGVQGLQGLSNQGVQGTQGSIGIQGSYGAQGLTGSFGGEAFDYTFSSSTVDSDPTQGKLRLNQTVVTTASYLYIHNDDDYLTDISSYLQTIDDSTSNIKGHFTIAEKGNQAYFGLFSIVGVHTEYTNYFAVPISYVSGITTSFTDNLDVIITFARTGDRGDTGAQGVQGLQGLQGLQGTQGLQGLSNQGLQGLQGLQGTQGLQGLSNQGLQGLQGTQGIQGLQGLQGTQGTQGLQGLQGTQGIQGLQGLQGTQGTQGLQGLQGTQGLQGRQGLQGLQGTQGLSNQGVQGVSGAPILSGNNTFSGITTFSGNIFSTAILQVQQVEETYNISTVSAATTTFNCSSGNIFYTSSPSSSWTTTNLTNLNLSSNCVCNVTILVSQGSTPGICTQIQIEGVSQTVNWQGGSVPSGTANKKDAIAFTIFYNGSTYDVFGQLVSFG